MTDQFQSAASWSDAADPVPASTPPVPAAGAGQIRKRGAPIGNSNNPGWPAEHVEALKTHWAGGLTCSQISAEMWRDHRVSYSRNAIIGKIHRLGLVNPKPKGFKLASVGREPRASKRHEPRVHITRVNSNSKALRITTSSRFDLPALRCVEVETRNISLLDLEPDDCRYPSGDGPYLFCGHPKLNGVSYCGPHFALCVGIGTESERSAGRI